MTARRRRPGQLPPFGLLLGLALVACGEATTPSSTPPTPSSTPGPGSSGAEADIATGVVTNAQREPVAGATIRLIAFAGGSDVGEERLVVETDEDGAYRVELPLGLYEVHGEVTLELDGQPITVPLQPADGSCGRMLSSDGIVEHFQLRVSGLVLCPAGADPADPADPAAYLGAAVRVAAALDPAPPDDSIAEYRFEPLGPLADGTGGGTLTYQRTIAAHRATTGPLHERALIHDIPLGAYRISAELVAADGSRTPLLVATGAVPEPAEDVEVRFSPGPTPGTLTTTTLTISATP